MSFEAVSRDKIYSIHIHAESSCEVTHIEDFKWSELRLFQRNYTFELYDIEGFPCSTILMDACLKIEELEQFVREKAEKARIEDAARIVDLDQVDCLIKVKVYTEKTVYTCEGSNEDPVSRTLMELWHDIYGVHEPDIEYNNENQYRLRAK